MKFKAYIDGAVNEAKPSQFKREIKGFEDELKKIKAKMKKVEDCFKAVKKVDIGSIENDMAEFENEYQELVEMVDKDGWYCVEGIRGAVYAVIEGDDEF